MINCKQIAVFLLIFEFLISGCTQDKIESKAINHYSILDTVELKVYKIGQLIDSANKIRATTQLNGNEYFIYLDRNSDTIFAYPLRFYINTFDSIQYWNTTCPLHENKIYYQDQDSIPIYIYMYDLQNAYDEEALIYCNSKMGLIAEYNLSWGILYFFENKYINEDIKVLIKKDILKERFRSFGGS